MTTSILSEAQNVAILSMKRDGVLTTDEIVAHLHVSRRTVLEAKP